MTDIMKKNPNEGEIEKLKKQLQKAREQIETLRKMVETQSSQPQALMRKFPTRPETSKPSLPLMTKTSYSQKVCAVAQHLGIAVTTFSFNCRNMARLKETQQISSFFQEKIDELGDFIKTDESGQIILTGKEEIQPILFNDLGTGKSDEEINLLKKQATVLYAIILASQNLTLINYFLASIQQCITSYADDAHINIFIALFKVDMRSQRLKATRLFTANDTIRTKITNYLESLCSDISEDGRPKTPKQKQEDFETLIDLFKSAMASHDKDVIKLFTDNPTIETKITNYLESLCSDISEDGRPKTPKQKQEDFETLIDLFKSAMASHSPDAIKLFTENDGIKAMLITIIKSFESEDFINILKNSLSSSCYEAVMFFLKNFYEEMSQKNTENTGNKIGLIPHDISKVLCIYVYHPEEAKPTFYHPRYNKQEPRSEGKSQLLGEFLIKKFPNLFEEKQQGKKRTRAERDKDETETPDTTEEMTDGTRSSTGVKETRQQGTHGPTSGEGPLSSSTTCEVPMETAIVVEGSDTSDEGSDTSDEELELTGEPSSKRPNIESPDPNNTGLSNRVSVSSMEEVAIEILSSKVMPISLHATNGETTRQDGGYDDGMSDIGQKDPQSINMGCRVSKESDGTGSRQSTR